MSNSIDPNEKALYEPSHRDLCCLQKPIIIAYDSERIKRSSQINIFLILLVNVYYGFSLEAPL